MTAEEFKNLPFDRTIEDDLYVLQGKSSRLRTSLIRQHAKKTLQKLEPTLKAMKKEVKQVMIYSTKLGIQLLGTHTES